MIPIIPGEVTKVCLPEDKTAPEGERTLFYLAAMSYRIQRRLMQYQRQIIEMDKKRFEMLRQMNLPENATKEQINAAVEEASKTAEGRAVLEADVDLMSTSFLDDTLGLPGAPLGLVGWEGMKHPKTGAEIPFDKEKYRDYLSLPQQLALARMIWDAQMLTRADVKN